MAGGFIIKEGGSGKFLFNLVAGHGQVIAVSQACHSKASGRDGIESVRKNAPGATAVDETGE